MCDTKCRIEEKMQEYLEKQHHQRKRLISVLSAIVAELDYNEIDLDDQNELWHVYYRLADLLKVPEAARKVKQ